MPAWGMYALKLLHLLSLVFPDNTAVKKSRAQAKISLEQAAHPEGGPGP